MRGNFTTARSDSAPDGARQLAVPWWSVTKAVLAAAALRLVAQGQLQLDEPFDGQPYTLRHLLQHRAGVPDYGNLSSYQRAVERGDKAWDVAHLLEQAGATQLQFAPGEGWLYSNVGYMFVRRKIEEVTGLDMDMALRRLVFDPLGMTSVRLAGTATDLAETAWGNARGYDPAWVYHGLLVGTAHDAVRFLHALMSGHVLPGALLAEMTKPVPLGGALPDRPWEETGYGLGLMIGRFALAGSTVGHSGGGPGSVSAVYHFAGRREPCTVAAFAASENVGLVEYEAARLATTPGP